MLKFWNKASKPTIKDHQSNTVILYHLFEENLSLSLHLHYHSCRIRHTLLWQCHRCTKRMGRIPQHGCGAAVSLHAGTNACTSDVTGKRVRPLAPVRRNVASAAVSARWNPTVSSSNYLTLGQKWHNTGNSLSVTTLAALSEDSIRKMTSVL